MGRLEGLLLKRLRCCSLHRFLSESTQSLK
jgi:hypothetical protein